MNTVRKLIVLSLFFTLLFSAAPKVSADLAFPDCRWDEITVSCNCPHANDVCADNRCSECLQYKNDPRYRYLWKDLYCRKGSVLELADKYKFSFIIPFLTAIALTLAVFAARGYRKTNELLNVLLAECLSFFAGMFLLLNTPINRTFQGLNPITLLRIPDAQFSLYGMNSSRLFSLLITAALMTGFNILFLVYIAKFGDRKRVIVTAVIANLVSLILGLGFLNAMYPHFGAPRMF